MCRDGGLEWYRMDMERQPHGVVTWRGLVWFELYVTLNAVGVLAPHGT